MAERSLVAIRQVPASMGPLVFTAAALIYMVNLREAHFSSMLQLASGWICVALLFLIGRFQATRRNAWRLVFVLLSGYLALRYLWWRSFETLLYTNMVDFVGMALLFVAELYSITVHLLGLFVNVWPLERAPRGNEGGPLDLAHGGHLHSHLQRGSRDRPAHGIRGEPDRLPQGQDEYLHLRRRRHARQALAPGQGGGCLPPALPLDGDREGVGAQYLTRETNRSAKAGNLNHALTHSTRRIHPLPRLRPRSHGRDPAAHARLLRRPIPSSSSCRRRTSS
jgi:cellulose synthase (UDP-forming)